ncbi:MAG: tetratricopeptide repeat protein, partial [Chloroflexota bacterium]
FDTTASILLVGTVRLEAINENHTLTTLSRELQRSGLLTEIRLGPLDAAETSKLAEVMAKRSFNRQVTHQLFQETEGNPLFIVETVRAGSLLVDQTANGFHNKSLLPQIQTIIDSRLDQLSAPARELINIAAVIGQAFTFELLAAISSIEPETLVNALDEAWQRHIIREREQGRYDFSHGKIQEAAYARLSVVRRRWLHQKIAETLENVSDDRLKSLSSRIAKHYDQAGQTEKAISYYWQAAKIERGLGALNEVVELLERGLTLLKGLPETSTMIQQELNFLTMLGSILTAQKGYGIPEAREIYTQALERSNQVEQSLQFGLIQFGMHLYYYLRGELELATALGNQLLKQGEQYPILLKLGHSALGCAYFTWGHLEESRHHFESINQVQADDQQFPQVVDLTPINLSHISWVLWYLGYPDQAAQKNKDNLDLVQTLTDPEQQSLAYIGIAWLYNWTGERDKSCNYSQTGLTVSKKYGLLYWQGTFALLNYWAKARQAPLSPAENEIVNELINNLLAGGAGMNIGWYRTILIEGYFGAGQYEEALQTITQAIIEIDALGGHVLTAEIYRLKGLLLSEQGAEQAAEAALQQALSISREQKAKSLELRAVMSLARLWHRQSKSLQAHHLLAEIYGWFTEGFDTHDLQEARSLLDQLSNS